MRTRERLIEVLRSVNGPVVGHWDAMILNLAADELTGTTLKDRPSNFFDELIECLRIIHGGRSCCSIRSLAADALHYLEPRP